MPPVIVEALPAPSVILSALAANTVGDRKNELAAPSTAPIKLPPLPVNCRLLTPLEMKLAPPLTATHDKPPVPSVDNSCPAEPPVM